jgi:hypothetical protein
MEREGEESRQAAGRALAAPLQPYAGPDVLVVGVSRGGILVGLEVARALGGTGARCPSSWRHGSDCSACHGTLASPGPSLGRCAADT